MMSKKCHRCDARGNGTSAGTTVADEAAAPAELGLAVIYILRHTGHRGRGVGTATGVVVVV